MEFGEVLLRASMSACRDARGTSGYIDQMQEGIYLVLVGVDVVLLATDVLSVWSKRVAIGHGCGDSLGSSSDK